MGARRHQQIRNAPNTTTNVPSSQNVILRRSASSRANSGDRAISLQGIS